MHPPQSGRLFKNTLWSDTCDREIDNILEIQDDIAPKKFHRHCESGAICNSGIKRKIGEAGLTIQLRPFISVDKLTRQVNLVFHPDDFVAPLEIFCGVFGPEPAIFQILPSCLFLNGLVGNAVDGQRCTRFRGKVFAAVIFVNRIS